MTQSSICLKPISALLEDPSGKPANYWIPAYQRGFRWSPLQVTQLLDDVWEFIQASEGGNRDQFYCLQPLVIKALPDGTFEVVDGQQRLTTIFIILTYLKEMVALFGKTRFRLTFETRGAANEPFLEHIDLKRAGENVDFFHICQAYQAVEGWFKKRDQMHRLKLLQHLLNDDEAGRNVKVIWFQLAERDNPVDAFTRLNVGKIPLTNDELIRALFLKRCNPDDSESEANQLRIAYEWDLLEKSLQADPFWYFLSNQKGKTQNRIGFLFELIAKSDGLPAGTEDDAHGIFYAFSGKLKDGADPESEWRKVKQTYMMLEEWFEDPILYHVVGFLVSEGVSNAEIRDLSNHCSKSEFDQKLRQRVFSKVIGGQFPNGGSKEDIRSHVSELLEELDYGFHRTKIRSVLLLFNLATLLQDKRSNIRFQFDSFKNERWDIEHVRSVTSDRPEKYSARMDWLSHCLGFLKSQQGKEKLQKEIEAFKELRQEDATDEVFDPLYGKLLKYFKETADEEADHSIGNLTLLDEHTNRSYKNAVFAVKRQRLLSLDQAGIFVPLCTRNVFLKCYSPQVNNVMFWSGADRRAYEEAILDTLVGFFTGRREEAE
jgi:hypothetical protein